MVTEVTPPSSRTITPRTGVTMRTTTIRSKVGAFLAAATMLTVGVLAGAGPAQALQDEKYTAVKASYALTTLKVSNSPITGYTASSFASWRDWDGNRCDERNDALARDLVREVLDSDGCTVLSGVLTYEPYTGKTNVQFKRGGEYANQLDMEHIVSKKNAWEAGAANWTKAKRDAFANDPLNLIAVDPSANRSKSDRTFDQWVPTNTSFRCALAADQIAVKVKYRLSVTTAEKSAMAKTLATCPTQAIRDTSRVGVMDPSLNPVVLTAQTARFSDVPATANFYDSIEWMATNGITSGYKDGTFGIRKDVTRGETVTFLYRYTDPAFTPPARSPFRDVPTSLNFYAPITWAASAKITTGYSDGTFRSTQPVTRGEFAAFLYRMDGADHTAPATSPFRDVSRGSGFYEAISWMRAEGLSTGYADGTYRPSQPITRGEISALLHRYHLSR